MFREVEESQTLLINTQSKNRAAKNKKVIKFGFGQSPFLPPKQVMTALANAVHRKEYSSVQGDLELREYMSQFHRQHNGLMMSPDNILIAPGSKILVYNILLAFKKADVFIPAPAWVSYAPQAKLVGHHIIKIPSDYENRWRITSESIRQAAKNKRHASSILILNYPGNPNGLTYSEAELKDIAETARALDICVISDEIYGLLNHNGDHRSFNTYYPEKTITTTGLSKWCGAGGWRFGAAFLYDGISAEFKRALIGIGSETYSCAPTPVQMAAKVAYQNYDEIKGYVDWQIRILKKIGTFCAKRLRSFGVRVHAPQGGFYLFPDFSQHRGKLNAKGIQTSNELCERLLSDKGVALLPATAFGFDPEYLAVRLAYVDFQEPKREATFDLKTDCPDVVEGIELIGEWLTTI